MVSTPIKISTIYLALILLTACNRNLSEQPLGSCRDGILNGGEVKIDCGGTCPPCGGSLIIPEGGQKSPQVYQGYDLIWSDEFSAEKIDDSKWSFHLGNGCPNLCGWGNSELQFYTDDPENIFLQEGNLVIRAIEKPINASQYTSARIHTDNKFEFQYGRVDIRAAMPGAMGTWAALWMLNKDYSVYNPGAYWPNGGEIDIMEYLGESPDDVLGTAHFGTDFPANHRYISKHFQVTNRNFDQEFHVFSLIWKQDKIQWLVNDRVYHEITPNETLAEGQPYPFNDKFFLLMNLSVGGHLPQPPVSSQYPSALIIDYVRVFQEL